MNKTNAKSNVIMVGFGVSPSIKVTLESLGDKSRIFCNTNGGMGGGHLIVVADVIDTNDKSMRVHLTESNRKMIINHNWVSYVEDVELWKQVNIHENDNFTSPIIKYFITRGGAKLEQANKIDIPNNFLLEEVELRSC